MICLKSGGGSPRTVSTSQIASKRNFTNSSRRWAETRGRATPAVYQPDVRPIRVMAVLRGRRDLKRLLEKRL